MVPKVIKSEEEYNIALNRLEVIFDAQIGTPEADELELLSLLMDNYEKIHYPIDLHDPIEAIKFRMEQLGLKPNDLAKVLGYRSRITEVLNKKRKLSLALIRRLNRDLHIPTKVLIQEY